MTREERRKRRERYKGKAKSANTLKAYGYAWAKFGEWCVAEGIDRANATPDEIADHLCEMADEGQPNGKPFARNTIKLRRSGLAYHYRKASRSPNPAKDDEVLKVLEGIARETSATVGQPDGLRAEDVTRIMRYARLAPKRHLWTVDDEPFLYRVPWPSRRRCPAASRDAGRSRPCRLPSRRSRPSSCRRARALEPSRGRCPACQVHRMEACFLTRRRSPVGAPRCPCLHRRVQPASSRIRWAPSF